MRPGLEAVLLLASLLIRSQKAQNITERPAVLRLARRAERFDVAKKPFEGFEALLRLDEATVITGVRERDPEAAQWGAWQKWQIDQLIQVNDYFSSVMVHGKGSGSTFFDPEKETLLNMSGLNSKVYHEKTVKEFFACNNEHNYIPGGGHPTFDPDVEPRSNFQFPKDKYVTHANLYWACKGTNTYSHYDRESVFLVQISGSKELLLTPPSELNAMQLQPALHPSHRQSALPFSSCQDPLDPKQWPAVHRLKRYALVQLNPGEAIYLPPLWLHSVCNLTPSTAISLKGTLPILNVDNLLWKTSSRVLEALESILHRIQKHIKSDTEEAVRIVTTYHLIDVIIHVLRKKLPISWFTSNRDEKHRESRVQKDVAPYLHPFDAYSTKALFIEVWIRYIPKQGKFLNDHTIEISCEDLKPWRKKGRTPKFLLTITRKMKKYFSDRSLDDCYSALEYLGRHGSENEIQDLIEMVMAHAVQAPRVNAALRAISGCLIGELHPNGKKDEL
eukprot:CAMPEP_0114517608 /NCGR_PEP_ID=MMETSP0109-20121206/17986_1 /TAXON_ID=29199 /ORGANISM="Chlorarachnion reptans, Strain CCCM449" /LENGTH=502 /DNA_ID=CAMNT_0001698143 /DNA_START=173 /DNA_END=1681 /DNA_ORIENTATION=-